jgi:hypothetical protein
MDKAFILAEIRRTAEANGGTPLGRRRFATETGIQESDWYGVHWVNWSSALEEAGLDPNTKQGRLPDEYLLEHLVEFILELDHFPVNAELRMKARENKNFPSHNTFRRFGGKSDIAGKVAEFASGRPELERVVQICSDVVENGGPPEAPPTELPVNESEAAFGSVYLLKVGKYFKVGRTTSIDRRTRELAIQLPQRPETVHVITTDDPAGVEGYWHRRFAEKRENGEWFRLEPADVRAFKRRKFM